VRDTAIDIYNSLVDFSDAATGGLGSKTAKAIMEQKRAKERAQKGRTDEYGEQVSMKTAGAF
jgi:hypothetical protein